MVLSPLTKFQFGTIVLRLKRPVPENYTQEEKYMASPPVASRVVRVAEHVLRRVEAYRPSLIEGLKVSRLDLSQCLDLIVTDYLDLKGCEPVRPIYLVNGNTSEDE